MTKKTYMLTAVPIVHWKAIFVFFCIMLFATSCADVQMQSPNGNIQAELLLDSHNKPFFKVLYKDKLVCDTAYLGLCIDSLKLYDDVFIHYAGKKSLSFKSPSNDSVHDSLEVEANEYVWILKKKHSSIKYSLIFRLDNEGFAYRMIIPGNVKRHVDGEIAEWNLPKDSDVWFSERNSDWKLKTYAGEWIKTKANKLYSVSSQGPIQMMPLLYRTKGGVFLLVSEASLQNYSGMRLRASENGKLMADFTKKGGFDVKGPVITPWRVLVVAGDLNELVNSDMIEGLNPAPDPVLFADESWVKPGRSLWSWWSGIDGKYMDLSAERDVIDIASDLGFEYSTLDEGWEDWDDKFEKLKTLSQYANKKQVGLFVWRSWDKLKDTTNNYSQMRAFLDTLHNIGIKGIKVDFLNGEGIDQINFTSALLNYSAGKRLLVNLHGCSKPTGEEATYPNQLTREAVRGLETNKTTQKNIGTRYIPDARIPGNDNQYISACHDINMVFSRCVIGPSDYTPIGFSIPGDLTLTHHLAMAYIIPSRLITIAENPYNIIHKPEYSVAIPFLKAIKTNWDETVVLPQSELDKCAILLKRFNDEWCICAVNSQKMQIECSLSFLNDGRYKASIISDGSDRKFEHKEIYVDNRDSLKLDLLDNGGAVCWIRKITQ